MMQKNKTAFFIAVVVFTGVLIITGCDGGNEDSPDPTSVPNAPTVDDMNVENRLISILWYVVEGADSYNLYWNTTGNVTTSDNSYLDLQTPYGFISFNHSGLSFFKTYYYRLTAVNALGESSLSSEVSAFPAVTIGELWKRASSDYEDGDEFGRSVAISGDYLIAGAPNEDDLGLDSGAVYLYNRDYGPTDAWEVIAKRTASDGGASDSFGHSVAISGDYVVV
ncbi:MAG: FG-GAP repeat protein, partial [Candidatus Aminicenantes bacterium]|nr:FG-GAP repeat protein [Candidatus Aminicenantes bacterium]